jgi:hypothetical protein
MTFPERRAQIDVFNDIYHPLRYFVCNIELVAEGVNLVGANNVWVESPIPRYEKFLQFIDRPVRIGQKEMVVKLRLLYNKSSPVDVKLLRSYRFKQSQKSEVSEFQDAPKEIEFQDAPKEIVEID